MNCFKKLKKFLEENDVTKIVFLSDNQDSFEISDPCVFQLYFSDVLINESIRRICFAGDNNRIRIGGVKDIQIYNASTPRSRLLKVVSQSDYGLFKKSVYTFIVHLRVI